MGKSSRKNSVTKADRRTDSTVFCDPEKKETVEVTKKKNSKKKIITVVVVALIFVLVVVPWGIVKIFSDNTTPGQNIAPISKRSQTVTEISDKAKLLYNARNPDPTDIDANNHIASLIGVTTYCGKHTIEVYEDNGEYIMRFVFEKPHSTSIDSVFYNLMLNYTIAMMALVEDIEAVEWTCPSYEGGEATSERITLANIEEYLNDSPTEYAKSEKTVQFMLNEHGLNDLTD